MCLVNGETEAVKNDGTLIAQLSGSEVVYTLATDAVNVNSPNSDWLNVTDSYLLKSRSFALVWAGGIKHTVRLDHGFGCWSIDGKPSKWFDINESPETQVSNLYSILRILKVRFSKKFHTQIFVKKIA